MNFSFHPAINAINAIKRYQELFVESIVRSYDVKHYLSWHHDSVGNSSQLTPRTANQLNNPERALRILCAIRDSWFVIIRQ